MGIQSYQRVPFLRAWRAVRGLSQAELAVRADVGVATIRRIEQGHEATARTVAALARALGVSIRRLVHDDPASSNH